MPGDAVARMRPGHLLPGKMVALRQAARPGARAGLLRAIRVRLDSPVCGKVNTRVVVAAAAPAGYCRGGKTRPARIARARRLVQQIESTSENIFDDGCEVFYNACDLWKKYKIYWDNKIVWMSKKKIF